MQQELDILNHLISFVPEYEPDTVLSLSLQPGNLLYFPFKVQVPVEPMLKILNEIANLKKNTLRER